MDQAHDLGGHELYRITQIYDPPEFVKTAGSEDLSGNGKVLPRNFYADPVHCLFPCHTPAATWTSYAFFLEKQSKFSPKDQKTIKDKLDQFVTIHNIQNSIYKLKEKYAQANAHPDSKLTDDDFLYVHQVNGKKNRFYPVRNSKEVQAAVNFLAQNRHLLPFAVKQAMAEKILAKSNSFGTQLTEDQVDFLEKTAGHGICSAKDCVRLISSRVMATHMGGELTPLQTEMIKMAKIIENNPARVYEPNTLYEVAKIVDMYDRHTGLNTKYGRALTPPEDVLFGINLRKVAAASTEHCVTKTGNIYKVADLKKLNLRDIEDLLGQDIAESMTEDGLTVDSEKAAEVISTLPLGDAKLFDEISAQAGVYPQATKEAAYSKDIKIKNLIKLRFMNRV